MKKWNLPVVFGICLVSPPRTVEAFLSRVPSCPGVVVQATTDDESSSAADVSFEKWVSSRREVRGLDSWATANGILMENGFQLTQTIIHNNNDEDGDYDDWNVNLGESSSASESDRVLHIPSHLIFSGTRIEMEIRATTDEGLDGAVNHVTKRQCEDQLPQFFLWIKILQEFEKGQESQWYTWIQSLPRQFGNALYLDVVEMECLPPYAWSLAKLELLHLEVFREALQWTPSVVSEQTRNNPELARWALSVVFTRCWGQEDDASSSSSSSSSANKDTHVAPIGDMLNHGDPANTFISYDKDGNCNIFLKSNVTAGSSLSLSYGRTTNPSRFLVLYGFVDLHQSKIFSQILVTNPSQQHKDLGYDVSKMVFSTDEGNIAEEVFDVTLFSILEQVPGLQKVFYEAHRKGDHETTQRLRKQYYLEICIVLKKHVDGKLSEMRNLLQKIDSLLFGNNEDIVEQQHPRLPTIFEHNKFLFFTFSKVKNRLDHMIQDEMRKRREPTEHK